MADEQKYRRNHYVPVWYQNRFLLPEMSEQKFRYLDLTPETFRDTKGILRSKTPLKRWGPTSCFRETDLYTTSFGAWISTEIEERFFGEVDNKGRGAVKFWGDYKPMTVNPDALHDFLWYMVLQKLRTPKGLAALAANTRSQSKNDVLMAMQEFQRIYTAIWAEAQWSIADASESPTKFLLSDHPVTVYNTRCFPGSAHCKEWRDPEPWINGTHTLFPLSLDKILILTNLSWVRNPYGDALKSRPNPNPFRDAMFHFGHIHTGRKLTETEVLEINHVIKSRAFRYIAAAEEEWLYPEKKLENTHWSKLGDGLLFMPDPRGVSFSTEIMMGGYKDGRPADRFDEYGRRPWQKGFQDKARQRREMRTADAFKGEFARLFGRLRRGAPVGYGKPIDEDSEDYHSYLVDLEIPELSKGRKRP